MGLPMLASVCATAVLSASLAPEFNLGTLGSVRVPGTGVSLMAVEGFVPAPDYPGLDGPVANSLIEAVIRRRPFNDETISGLRSDLRVEGRTADIDRAIVLDGLPARLFIDRGKRSGVAGWYICAGDATRTLFLRAEIPETLAGRFTPMLDAAMLGATWDRSVTDLQGYLPVVVKPAAPLLVAVETPTGQVFTPTGKAPVSARETMLSVFMAREGVPEAERAEFGVRMLAEHGARFQIETPMNVRVRPVDVNGLKGFETLADADAQGQAGLMGVYLTILFTPTRHYVALGKSPLSDSDEMLPAFRDTLTTIQTRKLPQDVASALQAVPASLGSRSSDR